MAIEQKIILPALTTLREKTQWVCWCFEDDENGRKTKIPYNARTGYRASSTNPKHWSSHEIALQASERNCNASGIAYDGIGFVFNEDYTGIDFDHCVKEDGSIEAWAKEWLDILNSFSEFSPSGTGVHVIAKGLIPQTPNGKGELVRQGKKVKLNKETGAAIEMYSIGRFFTVTGNHLPNTPIVIETRQEEIETLYAKLQEMSTVSATAKQAAPIKQSGPDNLSDGDLINKALDAKNGATFRALWHGDISGYGDHSSADIALCNLLAFWTDKDAHRMDRLFRQSGLYREKWDRNARSGETYGEGTIARAIDNCSKTYTGEKSPIEYPRSNNTAYAEKSPTPTPIETDAIKQAIESKDKDQLWNSVPMLAQLSRVEYGRYETEIKAAFSGIINMNSFGAAVAEARRVLTPRRNTNNAQYEKSNEGMVYNMPQAPLVLSNFTAEILADITTDDGAEQTRSYEVEAEMNARRVVFEIPAKDFSRCDWIDEKLGAGAQITVGQSIKPHLVNAIKSCSNFEERFHYAHTGWREIDGQIVYLHNGGVVSQVSQVDSKENFYLTHKRENSEAAYRANGERNNNRISQVSQVSQVCTGVSVKFNGPLQKYIFPELDSTVTIEAIHSSLRFLNLTDDTVTVPLYASLWRAPLGNIDYGMFVVGQSGKGKTQLVALPQAHFGSEMWLDKFLPGSWESTGNALEMLLSQAKDTIVVVDDFKPRGSRSEIDRLHATADRVFRSIGNGSERERLSSDLKLKTGRKPRCLLIATGEDVPKGQSLKARGVILTMNECITQGPKAKLLTLAQKDARAGLYAQAMAAYIAWLAPRIKDIQTQLSDLIGTERESLNLEGHARAGTNTANMVLGMKFFLQFACECGAISEEEAHAYLTRCITAFRKIAEEAARENHNEKPTEQWRRLIIAALANKTAHLVNADGSFPGMEYGWVKSIRTLEHDGLTSTEETYRGGGTQIGWVDSDHIYLLPAAAYKVARTMGMQTGDEVVTVETTLRKFLVQDKMVATTDLEKARKTITVRRRLENAQRDVLHFSKVVLYPDAPLMNSADSPDLLDSAPPDAASVAASGVSQVVDSNPSESSDIHDSVPQKVTQVANIYTKLKQKLVREAQRDIKKQVLWDVPGTHFKVEHMKWDLYLNRLNALMNGTEEEKKAVARYLLAKEKRGELA